MAAHLEVQVLETSHGGAGDRVDEVETLEVGVGADNDGVESDLILETVDVVGSVGVNVLERLCELVVEAVDKGDKRSLNKDGLAVLGKAVLVLVIDIGNVLLDNVQRVGLQNRQQAVQVLLSAIRKRVKIHPKILGVEFSHVHQKKRKACMQKNLLLPEGNVHEARDTGGKVELGRDQVQENNNLLVGGVGNDEKTLQDLDLLLAVGVFLSTSINNLTQLLVQVILGQLDRLAASANRGESIVFNLFLVLLVILRVRDNDLLGLLDLGLLDLLLLILLGLLVVVLGVLLVFLNLTLVLAVVLLDVLLERVEGPVVGGVQLLGGGLLLLGSGLDGLLQLGNRLDIELGDARLGNETSGLLDTLVGTLEL